MYKLADTIGAKSWAILVLFSKSLEDKVLRVQDKGSRLVVLNTNSYVEKVEKQINRSCF